MGGMDRGMTVAVPLRTPLFRGDRRLRVALAGSRHGYDECAVRIGLDEARLIKLPSLRSLLDVADEDRATLKYLLWGDRPAPVSRHDRQPVPAPFERPDLILQVVDATALERHLELTLELMSLGRPLVVVLNKMDEARSQGLYLSSKALARRLGVPVIPASAARGYGLAQLFRAAIDAARSPAPSPQAVSAEHLRRGLAPLAGALAGADVQAAFDAP